MIVGSNENGLFDILLWALVFLGVCQKGGNAMKPLKTVLTRLSLTLVSMGAILACCLYFVPTYTDLNMYTAIGFMGGGVVASSIIFIGFIMSVGSRSNNGLTFKAEMEAMQEKITPTVE